MFNIQRCYVRRFITLFLNTPDTGKKYPGTPSVLSRSAFYAYRCDFRCKCKYYFGILKTDLAFYFLTG